MRREARAPGGELDLETGRVRRPARGDADDHGRAWDGGHQRLRVAPRAPALDQPIAGRYLDTTSGTRTSYLAVEAAAIGAVGAADGGGRSPTMDTTDALHSALVPGMFSGVSDGLSQDDKTPSAATFPFLAAPN